MKIFYFAFSVFILSFSVVFGQEKFDETTTYQKTIQFNLPIGKQQAIDHFLNKFKLDMDNSFVSSKQNIDESGIAHQRHQQFYKGFKVEFGTLIIHSRDENVISINAELYNAQSLNLVPNLSASEGLTKAIDHIGATKYLWEDRQQSDIVGYEKPQGELLIFPIVKTGAVRLAYKYDVYAVQPTSRQEIYVDALNGQILYSNPIIKHLSDSEDAIDAKNNTQSFESLITGNANTKYSGLRNIETIFDTPLNSYVLHDQTRGAQIITYNCERIIATYQNVHFKDNDNNWTLAEHNNSFFDNAAQDGHWGAEMTYDFWKNIFNRNSYNDNNATIRSYVHYKATAANLSNAFWNGSFMTYGDGVSKPFTAIDICGHEIGHAVCTFTANLAYQNHSGAMNEGYSDIWGACIEHYGRTGSMAGTPAANVWRIGEDITTNALRSMSSPNTFGDPDCFHGTNYVTTGDDGACSPTSGNDWCGVHTNSGVLNHWFYILTAGKAGTNNAPIAERDTYNVTGIGMEKSSKIAYYAIRDYLTPNSTFFDAREATITVANNLYCASGPEVVNVTNAWFAVNIGPSFLGIANDVSLNEVSASNSINCGVASISPTLTFQNLGANALSTVNISYTIDGGAASNATWTGNLSTCSTETYQLTINTSGLSVGKHLLNITTTTNSDGNVSNNSKTTYIFVNQSEGLNQINTFESASDNLIAYNEVVSNNSLWERGISNKTVLTDAVAQNSSVYATNLSGFYTDDTKAYLTSRCYDLSTAQNPVLKFDMAFDMQNSSDVLYMQYSTDGGNNWSVLGTTGANWYNNSANCANCVGGQWTGPAGGTSSNGLTNGTKQQYSYNLSAFGVNSATPQPNMIFRFVFHSNAFNSNYDGAIIDNFVVETTLGADENNFSNFAVYPNPASSYVTVSFQSVSDEKVKLALYDVQGRLIKSEAANSAIGSFDYTIDMADLPTGLYLLKISQGDLSHNTKIIRK